MLRSANAQNSSRYEVMVHNGFEGVCHVVSMLRQRRYAVTELLAKPSSGNSIWSATMTVTVSGMSGELLLKRLDRITSVVDVRVLDIVH